MKTLKILLTCVALLCGQLLYAAPVNINTATANELAKALDGVGKKKARLIVNFREKNGDFTALNELLYVKGIGPKTIKKNKADIHFSDETLGAK